MFLLLILSLPMFGMAFKEHREREEALRSLDEVK